MSRFRPKTFLFSELRAAEGESIEDFVSMQAAPANRTARRRPGRPISEAKKASMLDALCDIRRRLVAGEPKEVIAAAYKVPVEVIVEFERSL